MQLKRKKSNQDLRTQSYEQMWACVARQRCTHRARRHMRTAGRRVARGGLLYVNRWTMTALSRLASFRVWFSSVSSLFGKVVMRTKLVAAIAGRASTMKSRMSRILCQGIKHARWACYWTACKSTWQQPKVTLSRACNPAAAALALQLPAEATARQFWPKLLPRRLPFSEVTQAALQVKDSQLNVLSHCPTGTSVLSGGCLELRASEPFRMSRLTNCLAVAVVSDWAHHTWCHLDDLRSQKRPQQRHWIYFMHPLAEEGFCNFLHHAWFSYRNWRSEYKQTATLSETREVRRTSGEMSLSIYIYM